MRTIARQWIFLVAVGLICASWLDVARSAPPGRPPARPRAPKPPAALPSKPNRPPSPKVQPARPPVKPNRPDPGPAHRPPSAAYRHLRWAWYRPYDPKMVRVWPVIRYPYYAGGASYVAAPWRADTSDELGASQDDPQAAERYAQLQELVDLVCQWRMLNESSAVHQRIPSTEAGGTLQQWAQLNASFDQTTRAAMTRLASGKSAGEPLSQAREHLAQLETLIAGLGAQPHPADDTG
ncbi:MAG TPA: hypothetical protein VMZ31_09050 [Phycisphaerae bacterium]|nr:hypothetical protein [Phycisphaerae bacterium]